MGWHGSCGFMNLWWLWWIAGLVLFFFIGRWFLHAFPGCRSAYVVGREPEQELKKRYAAGEIDRDEYIKTLEDLRR